MRFPLIFVLVATWLGAACSVGDEGGGPGDHQGSTHTMDGGGASGIDAAGACATDDPTPYMCPCQVADDTCDADGGDLCFNFFAKGPHCTHSCQGDGDCPPPSGGCNDKGVCKAPD